MRRGGRVLLGLIVLVTASAASAITAGPASAGRAPRLTVTKVVDGTAPSGAQWVVDIDCEGADIQPSSQLTFTGPGSQMVEVFDSGITCKVVESATSGAVVSYGCEITFNGGGGDSACTSDNAVFLDTGGVDATITVTNTYAPPTAPTPVTAEAPPAAEPVTAAAQFTG